VCAVVKQADKQKWLLGHDVHIYHSNTNNCIAVSWKSTSPRSMVAIHGQVLAKENCRGYSGLDNDEVLVSTGWWLGHFKGETATTTLCFPPFQPTHKLRCKMSSCTRLVGVHSSKHRNWVKSGHSFTGGPLSQDQSTIPSKRSPLTFLPGW